MAAYYNEFDPKAAAWLRELIKQGHIADGEVDGRSIVDVRPDELRGFTQCHFFAGIGVWSYALRKAGWADDRPVWTGSCPCQPFSAAGKGAGFADERHLWPHFHWLISQCQPPVVFGEQVASKDGLGWLDLVSADLEGSGYACGAVDLCAAGVGAPHIRQRLWWVGERLADSDNARLEGRREPGRECAAELAVGAGSVAGGLADAVRHGTWNRPGQGVGTQATLDGRDGGLPGERLRAWIKGPSGGMADAESSRGRSDLGAIRSGAAKGLRKTKGQDIWRPGQQAGRLGDSIAVGWPGPTNGLWANADWLFCRDGKWRPVEPGTFPLAHGAAERVGRLRGYGNAIVAPAAQAFIEAYCEVRAA